MKVILGLTLVCTLFISFNATADDFDKQVVDKVVSDHQAEMKSGGAVPSQSNSKMSSHHSISSQTNGKSPAASLPKVVSAHGDKHKKPPMPKAPVVAHRSTLDQAH